MRGEDPRVVDQRLDGSGSRGLAPQALDGGQIAEVGLDERVTAARQFAARGLGGRAVGLIVQQHRDAARGQRPADGGADAARSARDEYAAHAETPRRVGPQPS
jgi:hypothetical protein